MLDQSESSIQNSMKYVYQLEKFHLYQMGVIESCPFLTMHVGPSELKNPPNVAPTYIVNGR